jgi:von Willebrand factor type A domain-containing protein
MPTAKKAKKTKTPKTNVIFIIDESGSMMSTASDIRGGFNSYVEKLKGDGNDYSLTAIKFGTKVRPLFANLALNDVPKLTEENYMPLDSTALYDAIGHGMAVAKEQWGSDAKPYGDDPTLMIIMTDGFENASKEYNKDMIVAEMKKREDAGNWTFTYLGADQDAWGIASDLGFAQGNVLSYASGQTAQVFSRLANATSTSSSTGQSQTCGFFGGNP